MDVVFVAYHFPPYGGAGSQRSAKFVRYLPELGVRPLVVTRPVAETSHYSPLDESQLSDLPEAIPVLRAQPAPGATASGSALGRLLRLQSPLERWWAKALRETGREAARAGDPKAVYVSMDPFESAPAVSALARDLGLPWVADLRDPWALDEMRVYPTGVHRRLERSAMREVLGTAALVIANTPEAGRLFRAELASSPATRVEVLTNGFDAADFAGATRPRSDGEFHVVHTGYLHTALGEKHRRGRARRRLLGGERVPVDIHTRSHVYLLRALAAWKQHAPEEVRQVRVVLAGRLTDADERAIDASPVAGHVDRVGLLEHHESVALVRSADLLFLPMHDLPEGRRASIVPGKTYEYLAAERPILAAVPDGDTHDLLARSGRAHLCRPADVEALSRALRRAWCGRRKPVPVDASLTAPFERRALTERLADLLREVAAG